MFDPSTNVGKQDKTCDLHCKIIEIRQENDMFYEMWFSDQSGTKLFLKVSTNNLKQWNVEEGDIVRVRSIKAAKGTTNYIELTKETHILKFPPSSYVYQEINSRLKDDNTIWRMMSSPLDNLILDHPVTVSKTSERYNSIESRTLYELFHDVESPFYCVNPSNYFEGDKMIQSRYFRLRFNVLRIDPPSIEEFVMLYCEACNQKFSLQKQGEGKEAMKCPQCESEFTTSYIYQLQFLINDDSTQEQDDLHRLFLYSVQQKWVNFFSCLRPTNLYLNYKQAETLQKYVNLITKYNIYIEAIVELNYQELEDGSKHPLMVMHDCVIHPSYLNY